MLGYLGTEGLSEAVHIPLANESKLGRYKTKYHETAERILALRENIDAVVIPSVLGAKYDYNVLLLILHIRLSKLDAKNRLPIVISVDGEAQYEYVFDKYSITERTYNSIGVSVEVSPVLDGVEA